VNEKMMGPVNGNNDPDFSFSGMLGCFMTSFKTIGSNDLTGVTNFIFLLLFSFL
jgi:hypothetical protein